MASGVNKVILVGNLGREPEVRALDSGAKVASFSLATTESYKNREGQRVDQTEWHNIILWRGLAEVAEKYLHKGDSVFIEGKIKTRSYEKDGLKKYVTEIYGDNMTMLGKSRREDQSSEYHATSAATAPADNTSGAVAGSDFGSTPTDDDLPF